MMTSSLLRRSLEATLVAVTIGLTAATAATQTPAADIEAVYAAVLGDATLNGRTAARQVIVLQRQSDDPSWEWNVPPPVPDLMDPRKRLSYASTETVQRFLDAIKTQDTLPAATLALANETIDADDYKQLFTRERDGWQEFSRRFPGATGLIALSPVAFDSRKQEALVYTRRQCGFLCGEAYFVLLERRDGIWYIVKRDLFSQS
jgi:hypothetical protein